MADQFIDTAGEATRIARAVAALVAVLTADPRVQQAGQRFRTAPREFETFVSQDLRLPYSWLPMSLLRAVVSAEPPVAEVPTITVDSLLNGPRPAWKGHVEADAVWLELRSTIHKSEYMSEFDPRVPYLERFSEDQDRLREWELRRTRTATQSFGGRQPKGDGYIERDVEWYYRAEIKDPQESVYSIAQSSQRAAGANQSNINHSVVQNAIKRTKELLSKVPNALIRHTRFVI